MPIALLAVKSPTYYNTGINQKELALDQTALLGWDTPNEPLWPTGRNDADALLRDVIAQARAIDIPISGDIDPRVVINRRAKTRFGCCKKQGDRFVVELSHLLVGGPEASCRQVLAHEVLHSCRGCQNHGARWKAYAARMNQAYGYAISRTDSHHNLGIPNDTPAPRYVLVCTACGKEFPRMRASKLTKHPAHYRCRCGGRLKHKK